MSFGAVGGGTMSRQARPLWFSFNGTRVSPALGLLEVRAVVADSQLVPGA
jgi:hypothetical protein